jgi:hypothetical protein
MVVTDDESGGMSKVVVKCYFQTLFLYLSRQKTNKNGENSLTVCGPRPAFKLGSF